MDPISLNTNSEIRGGLLASAMFTPAETHAFKPVADLAFLVGLVNEVIAKGCY